ncbi:chromate transporter [Zhengella mangrovi]|uniref:Chromate transporter n=1 Tax=Zhengella mangrovi TaxID=1982044 RepID=A0A2G1QPI2_9HYPH|nr:chromate efflux transporter [Zhengella mangrovi]PHP67374.1 chromate transporter [Zhengella mangrovi]
MSSDDPARTDTERALTGHRDLLVTFGRIGLLSFGGPAGQIALMHRILVTEKGWLSESRFLHALNFCMVLPGPEAMQLATYAGWLKAGWMGGLIGGLLFVLPGFVILCALSALYIFLGDVPVVEGVFHGLSAAVLALVAEALVRLSKRALKGAVPVMIAFTSFLAIAFLKVPFPLIVLSAAIAGCLLLRRHAGDSEDDEDAGVPAWPQSLLAIAVWGTAWMVPLVLLLLALPGSVFSGMALFFSKAAVVTFGGAYAVLAYVGQQAVEVHGWLSARDMVTGLGLAETTPGPLILVLVFVGFAGGSHLAGIGPFAGGMAGAVTALWFTFAPCFLWILAGAPFMERLRQVAWLSAALSGVTAAVVGVIANLALWFGLHVIFGKVEPVAWGPFELALPALSTVDVTAGVLVTGSAIALLSLRWPVAVVLASACVLGIGIRAL